MRHALLLACLAWAVTASAQVPTYVPTDGLVSYLSLEGSLEDEFGGTGSVFGATSAVDRFGISGGCLQFSGNDWAEIQLTEWDELSDDASFTIACWIYADQLHPGSIIEKWAPSASQPYPVNFRTGTNGAFGFGMYGAIDDGTGTHTVTSNPVGEWKFVIGNYDFATRTIRTIINLSDSTVQTLPDYSYSNSEPVTLGRRPNQSGRYFYGRIDDIALWNRSLTPTELSQLFSGTLAVGCTAPEACNYDSEANLDDGSCNYPGCTDSEACNYDETAGCDDDSCVFPPLVELGSNTTLCEGESLELSVDAPGLTITWNTGATGSNLTITESGTYSMETDISISDSHSASTAIEFGPSNPGLVASASGGMNVYDEGEVTLASWVYAYDQPGSQRIIALTDNGSVYQQYAMSIEGQGRLYFLSGTSEFEANGLNVSFSAIPIDEWAHVAVTVKSDGVRMYINGILDRFNPVQDQFPTSWTSDFSIGMRSDGAVQFNGKLSQIAVWNRALGDVEIHELFECPVNPASPGLQALWLNGTNPDGTVIDESGNANNVAYGGTSEAGPTQFCLTPCSASDTITVNFIDCESLCGPGTTWDPILQSCVADTPDAAAAEDCSLFTLQQLSSGYLLQQGQLDLQDTLIIELQQQVDSLNALLNNCPGND